MWSARPGVVGTCLVADKPAAWTSRWAFIMYTKHAVDWGNENTKWLGQFQIYKPQSGLHMYKNAYGYVLGG